MPVKFVVSRSDVNIEAAYPRAAFGLFRDDAGLYERLISRLSPYGLKLSDMRLERGSGNLAEIHLFFNLLDYVLTVRIRLDRLEIYCSHLTEDNKKRVLAAVVDILDSVRENIGGQYLTYALGMSIHGVLENQSAKAFLRNLIAAPPTHAIGSVIGNAVGYYFSPVEDRIASSLTFDVSAVAADGLFARPQATWDASRVSIAQIADRAEEYVRHAFDLFGIEVP